MTKRVSEKELMQALKMVNELEIGLVNAMHTIDILNAKISEYERMSFIENSEVVIQAVTNILSKREAYNLKINKIREMIR